MLERICEEFVIIHQNRPKGHPNQQQANANKCLRKKLRSVQPLIRVEGSINKIYLVKTFLRIACIFGFFLSIPLHAQLPGSGNAAVFNNTLASALQLNPPVPTSASLPVTMAAWVNVTAVPGKTYYPIFSSHNATQGPTGFYMGLRSFGFNWQLEVGFGNGSFNGRRFQRVLVQQSVVNAGWMHVAGVINNANDIRVYVNGNLVTGFTFGNISAMANLPNLGSFIGNQVENGVNTPFSGQIEHLNVWNRALSTTEIRQFMCSKINPSAPGLLMYYDFDFRPTGILGFPSLVGSRVATGGATQVLSGAPIGDTSVYLYPTTANTWLLQNLSLSTPNGTMTANFLSNTGPNGYHIYQVRQPPNTTLGIIDPCLDSVYYGVFSAFLTNTFNYTQLLRYQSSNPPTTAFQRFSNNSLNWGTQFPINVIPGGLNIITNTQRREWIFPVAVSSYNPGLQASYTVCNFPFSISVPAPTNGTLLWSNGGSDTIKTFPTAGTYSLVYNDSVCNSTQTYTFTLLPTNSAQNYNPNIPDTLQRCVFPFAINVPPFPAGDLLWSDSSSTQQFNVTGPGNYSLTVTDTCNNSNVFNFFVANPPPAPVTYNPGIPDTLRSCSFPLVLTIPQWNAGTFLWSDSTTSNTFSVPGWGNYSLTMRDTCNNTLIKNFSILPYPFAGYASGIPDTLFRCVFPFLVSAAPFAGGTLFWPDSSNGANYSITGPGSYQLTAVDSCNNSQTTNFFVSASGSQPLPINMPDTLIKCPLDTAFFTFVPPAGTTSVSWSNGQTGNNFSSVNAGTFTLQIADTCGITSTKSFFVVNRTFPVVGPLVPSNLQFCKDSLVVSVALPAGFSVRWFDNSVGLNVTITQGGNYSYAVIDPCGGATNYAFQVDTISYLNYQTGLPDTVFSCDFPLWIKANPISNGFLLWPDNSSLDSFKVSTPGLYTLSWGDTCAARFSQNIRVISTDTIALQLNLSSQISNPCAYPIALNLPNIPNVRYQWSTGATGNSIVLTSPGVYSVEAIGPCGVIARDAVTLVALNAPVFLDTILDWCPGETVFLSTRLQSQNGYNWNTGENGSGIEVMQAGIYTVEIFQDCALQTETFVVEERNDCEKLYIPNAFTPNDDGKNDFFEVFGDDFTEFQLVLLNRWGQKVFETNSTSRTWDGVTDGVPQPGGVYSGVVRYRTKKGFFKERFFQITLIR